ncbi:MAG TPA: hypothetical protein PLL78_11630 [Fimbriimonadaceae bacterium]|nr:hypothetical protein [Fimbriimonadaceae bacterium]HRJ97325.1 hypothetical protein [Fimbriimonadaceae bacterium]
MKRTLMISGVLAIATCAMALTAFTKVFDETYKVKKDSALGKMKCMVCHPIAKGGKELNAYGHDLQNAMRAAKTKKMTAEILKSVESKDSDGDGTKNVDEIRADKAPGSK